MDDLGEFRSWLNTTVDALGARVTPEAESIATKRRRRTGRGAAAACELVITSEDGVLTMSQGAPSARFGGGRRRAGQVQVGGEIVERIPLSRLAPSKVVSSIRKLDHALTGSKAGGTDEDPSYGLRRITGPGKDDFERIEVAPNRGRILLIIHGTFSHSEAILEALRGKAHGRRYLQHLLDDYDHLLCFDHPTLSESPWLNARNLQLYFEDSRAEVDVITHSRGGLVTRWWLEVLDRGAPATRRAMFVGSPLMGTSLAAAPRLPRVLNLLLNYSRKIRGAADATSYLTASTGIFQILASTLGTIGTANRVDSAIAVIPGLAAQSRVNNNFELLNLRRRTIHPERYFAVQSNFEPKGEGWKFWRYFRRAGPRAANLLLDPVFAGPNDLVVDTISMASLTAGARLDPGTQVYDFKKSETVHHTNYFEQKETLDFFLATGF